MSRRLRDDAEGLDGLPAAAGEVRALDRHAAVLHGAGGELEDRGPVGGVVDGHVRRDALAQAIEHAVVHHVVHAAVAADLLAELNTVNAKFAGINLWWENDMIVAVTDIDMSHINDISTKAERLVEVTKSLGLLLASL